MIQAFLNKLFPLTYNVINENLAIFTGYRGFLKSTPMMHPRYSNNKALRSYITESFGQLVHMCKGKVNGGLVWLMYLKNQKVPVIIKLLVMNREPVGHLVATIKDDKLHVEILCTRKRLRDEKDKLGFGTILITEIINEAVSLGIKKITLDSVPSAVGFYKKMGFRIEGEKEGKNGLVNMALNNPFTKYKIKVTHRFLPGKNKKPSPKKSPSPIKSPSPKKSPKLGKMGLGKVNRNLPIKIAKN